MSQRAFRDRQAKTLRDLREENSKLKRVIKDMVEVSQTKDATALRSAIRKAAVAAGLACELSHHGSSSLGPGSLAHSDMATVSADISMESSWDFIPSGMEQQQSLPTKGGKSTMPHDLGPR